MLCKQLQFCLAGEPAPAQRNIMPPVFDPINPGHNKAAAPLKTKTRAFMGDYPEIEEAARDINSSSQTWEVRGLACRRWRSFSVFQADST